MKKLIFFISILIISLVSKAQLPTFQWARSIGSSTVDFGVAMVADASNNLYTIGVFRGTADFDPGVGVFNLTSAGAEDIFITKLNTSGNLIWAKQIGSIANEHAFSISKDASGNIYICGGFNGMVDFNPNAGVNYLDANGNWDAFVLKLDASGNFMWAKNFGLAEHAFGYSINVDVNNDLLISGNFFGTVDFNPGSGVFNLSSSSSAAFILKLDASGSFIWVKQFDGANNNDPYTLITDASGNIFITGQFNGSCDFDPGTSTFSLTSSATSDIFISKLDASGNFVWAKTIANGSTTYYGPSIALDNLGNPYLTGSFQGNVDFDPSAGISNLISNGGDDLFILKLDVTGNFVWAKSVGGITQDGGLCIKIDAQGNLNVAGTISGTVDIDPGTGVFNLNSVGGIDILIAKFDLNGDLIWAKNIGGTLDDGGRNLLIDNSSNMYVTGAFQNTVDFDPSTSISNLTAVGNVDAFILKMSQPGVGINENNYQNNISSYPNPTNDILNIQFENNKEVKIEITNALGQIVLEESVNSKNVKLDIKNLNDGIYFLKLISNDKIIFNQKIIKN